MALVWHDDLETGLAAARAQRRPLLIDFWKPG